MNYDRYKTGPGGEGRVTTSLPLELREALVKEAAKLGVSVAHLVAVMVTEYLYNGGFAEESFFNYDIVLRRTEGRGVREPRTRQEGVYSRLGRRVMEIINIHIDPEDIVLGGPGFYYVHDGIRYKHVDNTRLSPRDWLEKHPQDAGTMLVSEPYYWQGPDDQIGVCERGYKGIWIPEAE